MKIFWKPFILILGVIFSLPIILILAMALYSVIYSPDLSSPNDNELLFVDPQILEGDNSFFDLELAQEALSISKEEIKRIDAHLKEIEWDQEFARDVLNKNELAISHFLNATQKPKFHDPNLIDQLHGSSIPYVSKIISLNKLVSLQGHYYLKNDQPEKGIQRFVQLGKFGMNIQNSEVNILHYATALNMSNLGLDSMNRSLTLNQKKISDNDLNILLRELKKMEIGLNGLISGYKIEYETIANLSFKKIGGFGEVSFSTPEDLIFSLFSWNNYLYKPNKTMSLYADYWRNRIDRVGKLYIDQDPELLNRFLDEIDGSNFKDLDNIIGRILISVATPNFSSLEHKVFLSKTLLNLTKLNCALHVYKRRNGVIANSISEIVPDILSEIPIDPFDGKSIRYSKSKSYIYSVGKNLTDTGGSEGENFKEMDDPTIKVVY